MKFLFVVADITAALAATSLTANLVRSVCPGSPAPPIAMQIDRPQPSTLARYSLVTMFEDNPPFTVARAKYPMFNGLGVVERQNDVDRLLQGLTTQIAYGNAISISPCRVLTTMHGAFGELQDSGKWQHHELRFSVGLARAGTPFADKHVITPQVTGDFGSLDWAVSFDPSCAGSEYGYYKPSTISKYELQNQKAHIMIAALDQGGNLSIAPGIVTGIDQDSGFVMTTASGKPGQSGAAVFVVDGKTGELALQGIYRGGRKATQTDYTRPSYSDFYASEFKSIEEIVGLSRVAKALANDPRKGAFNPIEQYLKVVK